MPWLRLEPSSTTRRDFDDYVEEYNAVALAGREAGLPLVRSATVTARLGLRWDEVLSVARGDVDHASLVTKRESELLTHDDELGLIGARTVSLILGIQPERVHNLRRQGELPAAVVRLGNQFGWVATDIVAYRDGKPFPRREPGEMHHLIMGTAELAGRLDYTRTVCAAPSTTTPPACRGKTGASGRPSTGGATASSSG